MGENLSILKKGLVLIAIPLAFLAVFFVFLVKEQRDSEQSGLDVLHTKIVIGQAETSYRYMVEALSSVRALAVIHETTLYDQYQNAARRARDELPKLYDLVHDNPTQQTRVRSIMESTEAFLRGLSDAAEHIRAHPTRKSSATEIGNTMQQDGLQNVRGQLDTFLAEEVRLDSERVQALKDTWKRENLLILLGAFVTVVTAVGVAVGFSRGIGQRVAVLIDNVHRLGDKQELTNPLRGHDEIGRLDRAFHDMARRLREREEENEMFVFSVSHDLRSPLVNLQGFSEELAISYRTIHERLESDGLPEPMRQRILPILDEDIPESIRFIRAAVSRLSGIIDGLLRLSRAGRVEIQDREVNVQATVERVVEALGKSAAEHHAEVIFHDLPPAWGDPAAMERIFANLIGNAINYLDPARPGRVEIGTVDASANGMLADMHTYYVKDNGRGIPATAQPRLFLAFQRLHSDVAQGEGIGLALVHRMVRRLGGRIWTESAAGVGSTFFVALRTHPAPATAEPPSDTIVPPLASEGVLSS